jgi:transcription initiation factor TFIIB
MNNVTINNDIDLYYQLNINNNKNEPKILDDDNDDLNIYNFNDYEKMIENIYNDKLEDLDIINNNNNDYNNNFNIEYNDYITNNTKTNNINKNKNIKNKNIKNKKKIFCDECNSDNIIEDTSHGILVCANCGQVISSLMDCGAEWTQYNDDNKKDVSRCSHPISQLLPQSSMATTISGSSTSRIKTLHGWSAMPYKERSLNEVFKIIQLKCTKGRIMKCIEDDAKIMYKNISECKHLDGKNIGKSVIIRGKNRLSVIAASILFACRKKDKTRSPKEIAEIFELKHTEITKGCKIFQKLAKLANIDLVLNTVKPEQFIIRFCEELKIKKNFIDQSIQISNNILKLQIASVHTPLSLATGSIYMMIVINELNIQKKTIADKFNVSQVTIAKAYKKLEPFTNLLTNNELCDRLSIEIKKYQDIIELTEVLKPKLIRFNIDIEKIFDSKYNTSSLYNIFTINKDNKYIINNNLIVEHTIEIDNKLKQIENEFIKLNINFTNDLHKLYMV